MGATEGMRKLALSCTIKKNKLVYSHQSDALDAKHARAPRTISTFIRKREGTNNWVFEFLETCCLPIADN